MSPPWPEADQTLGLLPWVRPPPGRGGVGARRPRARTLSTDLSPLDTQECTLKVQEGKFKLQDLLVVPMQRVLKYHLLLKVGLPLPAARAASGPAASRGAGGMRGRAGGVYGGRWLSLSALSERKSCGPSGTAQGACGACGTETRREKR